MKAAGKLHDTAHDAAAFAAGGRVHMRSRLGFGDSCRVGPFLLISQKRSAQSQSGGAMSIGHEAEVTNAMEAVRQGVQQEATNELVGGQLHDLCRVVVSVILPGEPDIIIVDLDEAASRDLSNLLKFFAQSHDADKWPQRRQDALYAFWIAHFEGLIHHIQASSSASIAA